MNYCRNNNNNTLCEFANSSGYCINTACTKSAVWNSTHSPNEIYNCAPATKRDDGVYMQLFCVKNGVRYDMKVIDIKEVSAMLTNSLMDGIEKLCT